MKRIIFLTILLLILYGSLLFLFPQEEETQEELKKDIPKRTYAVYDPGGRRDPFRDLLAGREVKEKTGAGGVPQISINDINLVGIAKTKGKYTAIISGPQGFPFFIKVGDKFEDGFVLSITEDKVIFRQTKQRSIPLIKPRDIVKEIKPEER